MAYATLDDLTQYTGSEQAPGSERMLQRASDLLDVMLLNSIFTVDAFDVPTDPVVLLALKNAACAQVEWWGALGDELGAMEGYQSMSLGPARLTRSGSGGSSSDPRSPEGRLAPRARDELIRAKLWPNKPTFY